MRSLCFGKQYRKPYQLQIRRTKMERVRIYLADDHTILREGLKLILQGDPNFQIIGEAGDGKEALEEIEALNPDVAVVDISMPTIDGIEITRQLKKYRPDIKIIILTKHDTEEIVHELLRLGINAYVLKEDAGKDMIGAVKEALAGNIYLSPRILQHIIHDYYTGKQTIESLTEKGTRFSTITPRERQVLKMIAEGKSNREIGRLLRISETTVKGHRNSIMRKLGIHKSTDLIKYAVKQGLIEL